MQIYSTDLGRVVTLREGTSDEDVYAATFNGRYHLPPPWMPTPATVLDLGANIGLTAAHYSRLYPHAVVTAVEMDHANCAQIHENWPGGLIVEAAVVVAPHEALRYDPAAPAEAFTLLPGPGTEPALKLTMVECCELAAGLAPVDLVKMDIEGMEWHLFNHGHAWSRLVRHLIVELHLPSVDAAEARLLGAAKLHALGYQTQSTNHPAGLFAWR